MPAGSASRPRRGWKRRRTDGQKESVSTHRVGRLSGAGGRCAAAHSASTRRATRRFAEPCAGDDALVRHLESFGFACAYQGGLSTGQDALAIADFDGVPVITNPPWSREVLHELIAHVMRAAPFVWLLFDADWAQTRQSAGLIRLCTDVLPIGRLKWIAGSPHTGKDNVSWYRFEGEHRSGPILHGRELSPTRGSRTLNARSSFRCRRSARS